MKKFLEKYSELVLSVGVILLAGIVFLGYRYDQTAKEFEETKITFATTKNQLETTIDLLNKSLSEALEENQMLGGALTEEQQKNSQFEDQIQEIVGTVGQLDKLAKTDPELLQKYSKVFFLNEHYVPESLRDISKQYLYDESQDMQVHSKVWPFLREMIEDAEDDGVTLYVRSAFRSFGTQAALKTGYVITYGAGTANQFSAEQGFSEHQLGTTVDFTTTGIGGGFTGFENTEAYEWLTENAHKYGFTLSYPEGNNFYQYEPWHWRFVGEDLARHLKNSNKHFYDLDQREIDSYLIELFD